MKPFVLGALICGVLAIGIVLFVVFDKPTPEIVTVQPVEVSKRILSTQQIIGKSVEGRAITAYTYGTGKTHLIFVGGIHGGYEWNSVLLSYVFIDYLEKNPTVVSSDVSISIIPSLNPDGVYKVVGKEGRFLATDVATDPDIVASARFNAHDVDLNRNFDCNWQPKSMWRSKKVSAGTAPFSEPEARAFQSFILKNKPEAVIFWHSQSNAVYASECNAGILPGTLDIMNAYSSGSKYPAVKSFTAYKITGDAEGWLASITIPAITVELATHESVEWERNLAGIKAVLEYYKKIN